MKLSQIIFLIVVCLCIAAPAAMAQSAKNDKARDAALRQLQEATGGAAAVSVSKATGAARFIRLKPEASASLGVSSAPTDRKKKTESIGFFRKYGAALGITD